jgi:hypothetical protein
MHGPVAADDDKQFGALVRCVSRQFGQLPRRT